MCCFFNIFKATSGSGSGVLYPIMVGPKILAVGKTLHEMIIRGMAGSKDSGKKGFGNVTHETTGRDFRIVKIKKNNSNGHRT